MSDGQIVKFDHLSLYDAMTAIEVSPDHRMLRSTFLNVRGQIMDPRVDTGMAISTPSTAAPTFDPRAALEPLEVLAVMDKLLALEVPLLCLPSRQCSADLQDDQDVIPRWTTSLPDSLHLSISAYEGRNARC
jgi:hypothetical protein